MIIKGESGRIQNELVVAYLRLQYPSSIRMGRLRYSTKKPAGIRTV
jgi:hypothetical protein